MIFAAELEAKSASVPFCAWISLFSAVGAVGTFNRPTDVTWDSQDNIFISDGYNNSRVVKIAKDGKWITLSVVNPTTTAIEVSPALTGAIFAGNGTRYHLGGKDEFAHNVPGQPRAVDIVKTDGINPATPLAVPAMSATLFVLPLK